MSLIGALALVVGCTGQAGVKKDGDPDGDPDTGRPPVVAEVLDLRVADNPGLVLEKVVTITLSGPAALALRCARDDRPTEIHLVESTDPAETHVVRVAGLAPDREYTCTVAPVDVQAPAPRDFRVTTEPLPSDIPSATAQAAGVPAAEYTLVPHQRLDAGETSIRLLLFDNEGVVRWYYPLPVEGYADMGAEYYGDGLFLWGGVSASAPGAGAPRLVTVSHEEVYRAAYEGAAGHSYHHIAERQPDGTVVTLVDEGDFQVHQVDLETDTLVWSWRLSDHPEIEVSSYGDANWAGIMTRQDGGQTMVISMCADYEVLGVDMETGALAWSLGADGTLTLTDGTLPRCQHGLDIDGQALLLHDNGARPTSRAVEYTLDEAASSITQTWEGTEAGGSELGWGDVDYLGTDRVVVTRSHAESWGDEGPSQVIELDRTDDSEVWRLAFDSDEDSIYSADRIGGCALFGDTSRCPALAARLGELAAWFQATTPP